MASDVYLNNNRYCSHILEGHIRLPHTRKSTKNVFILFKLFASLTHSLIHRITVQELELRQAFLQKAHQSVTISAHVYTR